MPSAAEMEPILRKFARAREHLEALDEMRRDYLTDGERMNSRQEVDRAADEIRYVVTVEPPPTEMAILAGELLYGLMSGLDHLANVLTEPGSTRTTFPIFKGRSAFYRKAKGGKRSSFSGEAKVKDMPRWAQDEIVALQPFNVGEPASHPLWLLHQMANHEKHQALLPTVSQALGSELKMRTEAGLAPVARVRGAKTHSGPVETGTVLASFPMPPGELGDAMARSMEFNTVIYLSISAPEAVADTDFVGALEHVTEYVETQVTPRFVLRS